MKQKAIKRKLIMSILAASMTAVCLTSTTYAWFARNTEAWTEDIDFNLEGQKGLQISLDGNNFYQDISSKDFKKYIVESKLSEVSEDIDYEEEYSKLSFGSVTLSQTEGKIDYSDNGDALFKKDFIKYNEDSITHEYQDALKNDDYLAFDLYFKLVYSDLSLTESDLNNFHLRLIGSGVDGTATGTKITCDTYTLPLINNLTTFDPITKEKVEKKSGDTLDVNLKDAMRLAFGTTEVIDNQNVNKIKIYESTGGLGSAAIEGSEDIIHNKEYNAMYTYYNNYFGRYPFEKAAEDGEAFNTSDIDQINDEVLASFTYNEESKDFDILKVKVYIWVEGWDADNLYTLPTDFNKAKVSLDFKI